MAAFWEILEVDVAKFVAIELRRMEKGQQRTAENLTSCLNRLMWAAASQVRMNNYKTHQSGWCEGSFIIRCCFNEWLNKQIMHRLTQVNGQCEEDPFSRSARKRHRGAAAAAGQRAGRTGGHPRASMKKKIQLDTGTPAAGGASTRKKI